MSTIEQASPSQAWYALDAAAAASALSVDTDQGLAADEAQRRLATYGPNQLTTEPPPSLWSVALGQLSNPMNIMLIIVSIASLSIGQVGTGIFVALLVTFNVVMGSRQELKARASVDALAQLQVPHARVRRAGRV
jgi:Ca2+-transporting ATPase